jgi:hypothetical protein
MLVAKFVDNDYICNKTKFSNFGMSIEKDILVLPINEEVEIAPMGLKGKAILLEISEEDIVDCKRNNSFHVNKAIPIRNLNDDELSIIRTAACKDPYYAYWYAIDVDKKPTNETRFSACQDPKYVYKYALYVDKKPTNKTRNAACQSPEYAYWYALYVDKNPTPETKLSACQSPKYAYWYALYVDKSPTQETKAAASKDQYYKREYERWEKNYSNNQY